MQYPTIHEFLCDNGHHYESKEYLYNGRALEQMMWVRDKASLILPIGENESPRNLWQFCNFHVSKSVKLPVYYYNTDDILIVMRNNFYDWNVSVKTNKPIIIPSYMDMSYDYLFFQGMEGYKFESYKDNQQRFSFMSPFNEHLWAILWCITTQAKAVSSEVN